MVSVADGLRMMQGGVDRTGFADMADALGNPGLDLIRERRAAAAEAAAMDEFERLLNAKTTPDTGIPPIGDPNRGSNPNVDQSQAGTYIDEEGNERVMGDEFQSISGTDAAIGILDPIGTALGVAGSAFEPMTDEEIDDFYKGPAQDQLYGGYGFDKFKDTYDLEKGDTNIFGNEVLMDSPMLVDPELRSLYEDAAGFEDGGRVGMFLGGSSGTVSPNPGAQPSGGGLMNLISQNPLYQTMLQQYRQPTMNFSQVASSSIPQQTLASPTPAQAYTPFVSTMPLYDPSTLGTGLPSTAGMADPYTVYDPYSPVGAFNTPKARTTGFLSREQIDKGFADVDKYSLAKQRAKREAEEAAKAKTRPRPAKGGGGKENRDRFMANKNKNTKTKNKSAKHSGLKGSKAKGPDKGGSIHG